MPARYAYNHNLEMTVRSGITSAVSSGAAPKNAYAE
jgi:hypothetical protein